MSTDDQHPIAKYRLSQDPPKTQESLGADVGVDGMTISRWERGESLPQKRHWPKLQEVTNIPIEIIIAAATKAGAKSFDTEVDAA